MIFASHNFVLYRTERHSTHNFIILRKLSFRFITGRCMWLGTVYRHGIVNLCRFVSLGRKWHRARQLMDQETSKQLAQCCCVIDTNIKIVPRFKMSSAVNWWQWMKPRENNKTTAGAVRCIDETIRNNEHILMELKVIPNEIAWKFQWK